MARDMLIHVTAFLRDREAFDALTQHVFLALARKEAGSPIRIWVPGCSTGEEVYSVAMCLLEALGEGANRLSIKIFGSDLSEEAVQVARAGYYSDSALTDVSPARLSRFFERGDGGWRVGKPIRDLCVFVRHDITRDPPFAKLDLDLLPQRPHLPRHRVAAPGHPGAPLLSRDAGVPLPRPERGDRRLPRSLHAARQGAPHLHEDRREPAPVAHARGEPRRRAGALPDGPRPALAGARGAKAGRAPPRVALCASGRRREFANGDRPVPRAHRRVPRGAVGPARCQRPADGAARPRAAAARGARTRQGHVGHRPPGEPAGRVGHGRALRGSRGDPARGALRRRRALLPGPLPRDRRGSPRAPFRPGASPGRIAHAGRGRGDGEPPGGALGRQQLPSRDRRRAPGHDGGPGRRQRRTRRRQRRAPEHQRGAAERQGGAAIHQRGAEYRQRRAPEPERGSRPDRQRPGERARQRRDPRDHRRHEPEGAAVHADGASHRGVHPRGRRPAYRRSEAQSEGGRSRREGPRGRGRPGAEGVGGRGPGGPMVPDADSTLPHDRPPTRRGRPRVPRRRRAQARAAGRGAGARLREQHRRDRHDGARRARRAARRRLGQRRISPALRPATRRGRWPPLPRDRRGRVGRSWPADRPRGGHRGAHAVHRARGLARSARPRPQGHEPVGSIVPVGRPGPEDPDRHRRRDQPARPRGRAREAPRFGEAGAARGRTRQPRQGFSSSPRSPTSYARPSAPS